MAAATHRVHYTIEDYLRVEAQSGVKHEYLDGNIYAMAGGSLAHAAIAMAVGTALSVQLRGKRCRVYSSDARVRVVATGLDTYPDVSVACGHEERDGEDKHALVNPTVLVEVTSPATDAYDRGDKLEHYKKIPALREVVLVAHGERRIEVWRRGEDGAWSVRAAGAGESAELASLACKLDVDEVYRDPLAEG